MLRQISIDRHGFTFNVRDLRTTSDYNGRCDENPYRVIVWTDRGLVEYRDVPSIRRAIGYILSFRRFAWF